MDIYLVQRHIKAVALWTALLRVAETTAALTEFFCVLCHRQGVKSKFILHKNVSLGKMAERNPGHPFPLAAGRVGDELGESLGTSSVSQCE